MNEAATALLHPSFHPSHPPLLLLEWWDSIFRQSLLYRRTADSNLSLRY
jgi:hypothetical protein